jgi:hypothetical protein
MDKGEGIMAIPQGDITTSEILVPEVVQDPVQDLDEAIAEADAEVAVEEYDDFDPEQV